MPVIYVFLPDEATPVWAPMDAEHVQGDVYRITDCRGEDEGQFGDGDLVRCRKQVLESDVTSVVAYEAAE